MERIDIYPSRTISPHTEDSFTPLVAKGLTYQVGEAIRHAHYRSDAGTSLHLVPEATLRGVVEQYQDFYLAALQAIAGTHLATPPKDVPAPIRYMWAPNAKHGLAVTIGRMYAADAVAQRRTNRLRKYGLIKTKGHSKTYEVNFLATHPSVAEAVATGFRHAAEHCGAWLPSPLLDSYVAAAEEAAKVKCAELGATVHDKLYPTAR